MRVVFIDKMPSVNTEIECVSLATCARSSSWAKSFSLSFSRRVGNSRIVVVCSLMILNRISNMVSGMICSTFRT